MKVVARHERLDCLRAIHARLHERFKVLTGGSRAGLRRHQTLRAALDWSHGLLSPPEQAVFRRLGVFAGGFTLEAAQQVAEDEAIDGWDVLEHLGALVDKSLVQAEGDAVPRANDVAMRQHAVGVLVSGSTASSVFAFGSWPVVAVVGYGTIGAP